MEFSKLIRSILTKTIFLGIVTICMIITGNYYFHLKSNMMQLAQLNLKISENNIYQILPSLLLKEEYGSVKNQLDLFRKTDSLIKISIVNSEPNSSCESKGEHIVCYNYFNKIVETYYRFPFNGEHRYLFKSQSVTSNIFDKNFLLLMLGIIVLLSTGLGIFVTQSFKLLKTDIESHLLYLGNLTKGKLVEKPHSEIKEVIQLGDSIEELLATVKESEKQLTLHEVSKKLAHDIRSPISALQIVASTPLPFDNNRIQLLKDATKRVTQIADDLLQKSRSSMINNDVLSEIRALIREKEFSNSGFLTIEFKSKIDLGKHRLPQAMLSQLIRVLSNLINNAVDACATMHSCKIYFSFYEDNDQLVFQVADDGPGISDEKLLHLFDGKISQDKTNSNGIGLRSAEDFLKSVSGNISIVATSSIGTTFQVSIPIISNNTGTASI